MTESSGAPAGHRSASGRIEGALDRLRRVLTYEVSVGALIEVALWLAIPYLSIGLTWAFLHAGQVKQIENRVAKVAPAGADVAAFWVTVGLWPASIQIANACPVQ